MESDVTLYLVFTLRPIPSILQFPVMTQLRLVKQKDNRHSDTSDSWQLMAQYREGTRKVSIITGEAFRTLRVYLFKLFSIIGKSYRSISNSPLNLLLPWVTALSLIIDLFFPIIGRSLINTRSWTTLKHTLLSESSLLLSTLWRACVCQSPAASITITGVKTNIGVSYPAPISDHRSSSPWRRQEASSPGCVPGARLPDLH